MTNEFENLMLKSAPYLRGGSKTGTPLRTPEDIKNAKIKIPATKLMSEEWKASQKDLNLWWADPSCYNKNEYKKHNKLRERLIAIGGENAAVCETNFITDFLPNKEYSDTDIVLNYGQLLYAGYNVVVNPFTEYSSCFLSSQYFYLANKKCTRLCYGYALSDDGLWREHCWVILLGKNNIIECTPVRRLVYYGTVLPSTIFPDNLVNTTN